MVLLIIWIARRPTTTQTVTMLLAKAIQWPVILGKNAASLKSEEFTGNVAAELQSEKRQLHPCEEVWLRGKCHEEEEEKEGREECVSNMLLQSQWCSKQHWFSGW